MFNWIDKAWALSRVTVEEIEREENILEFLIFVAVAAIVIVAANIVKQVRQRMKAQKLLQLRRKQRAEFNAGREEFLTQLRAESKIEW